MQTDFLRPHQAAALKLHPAAADFDRGEAPRTVALGGLEAFRAITQTHQLSICGRDDTSSPHTHAVHTHTYTLLIYLRQQTNRKTFSLSLKLARCLSGKKITVH